MPKVVLALLGLSLIGCQAGKNQTNIELIQDMMDQISLKTQDWDEDVPGDTTMKVPPEGTVPVGYEPLPEEVEKDPVKAGQRLKNPLAGDYSPETLTRGGEKYRIYCGVCHGNQGMGKGPVAKAMAVKPPSIIADRYKDYKDGRLYHVVTQGYGVMGGYGSQIPEAEDRWAVVNYVRTLQKRQKPQEGQNNEQ